MSRPKKLILLYCRDDNRRMEFSYFLKVRCNYEVIAEVAHEIPDMVLIVHDPHLWSINAALALDEELPNIPTIVLGDPTNQYPAHSGFAPADIAPLDLVERIKVIVARKRGPKKGTQRSIALTVSSCEAVGL